MAKYTSDSKMKKSLKTKWIKALRSGEYKQARGKLEQTDENGAATGHCCLGVLCRITKVEATVIPGKATEFGAGQMDMPRPADMEAWGLGPDDAHLLAEMNDGSSGISDNKSFKRIATFIEKNIPPITKKKAA